MTRRGIAVGAGAAAVAALVLSYGFVVGERGCTPAAHYALVRALADGTARIDAYQETTCDKAYTDGHFYSVKAPGLAAVSLPVYFALDAVGAVPEDDLLAIWLLALWAVVLPAALLLLVVWRLADRLVPRTGLFAAVALGAGTMVLPFSTAYFSHVPAALLVVAAFALLVRERDEGPRPWLLLAAGALAGASVLFEYPTALAGAVLGIYAIWTRDWLRRGLVYSAGVLVGVAPLFLYNWWAFGSPAHLSYANVVQVTGDTGHDVVAGDLGGFFGVTAPSLTVIAELLVSDRGLLVLSPVVAAGVAGLVLLARAGRRAESVLIGGLCLGFVVYNSGLTTPFGGPFGGDSPGPRYLLTILPFLALPLGAAARRAPAAVLALALLSVAASAVVTATDPFVGAGETSVWSDRLRAGDFTDTVLGRLDGSSGWIEILPLLVLLGTATVLAVRSVRPGRLAARDVALGAAAVGAWALVAWAGPELLDQPSVGRALLALGVAAAGTVLVLAAARVIPERAPERAATAQ